jgi:hypothetical protein
MKRNWRGRWLRDSNLSGGALDAVAFEARKMNLL